MIAKFVLVACVSAVLVQSGLSLTYEEFLDLPVLDNYPPMVAECAAIVEASDEQVKLAFNSNIVPDDPTERCLITCIYINLGIVDEDTLTENEDALVDLIDHMYTGLTSHDNAVMAAQECSNVYQPIPDDTCGLAPQIRACIAQANVKYGVTLSAWKPMKK